MTTSIEWTTETWNPTVGCSRVSAGCENCYAERVAHRGMQDAHKGLTVMGKKGPRWNGEVRLLPERLATPLRWRKPRKVFVDSMSDLFHEGVPFEYVAAVFGVMAACPQHTFQVLTKRPERALDFFSERGLRSCSRAGFDALDGDERVLDLRDPNAWPLPNVWLGVSVEDQATADARIPYILRCPAAVRWVSYEPALGPVDFGRVPFTVPGEHRHYVPFNALVGGGQESETPWRIDWVVVGGESGPGARAFDLAWARSTIEQCRAAGTACFVKQLGRVPQIRTQSGGNLQEVMVEPLRSRGHVIENRTATLHLRSRKGADTSEWPADLRVQEFPGAGA